MTRPVSSIWNLPSGATMSDAKDAINNDNWKTALRIFVSLSMFDDAISCALIIMSSRNGDAIRRSDNIPFPNSFELCDKMRFDINLALMLT